MDHGLAGVGGQQTGGYGGFAPHSRKRGSSSGQQDIIAPAGTTGAGAALRLDVIAAHDIYGHPDSPTRGKQRDVESTTDVVGVWSGIRDRKLEFPRTLEVPPIRLSFKAGKLMKFMPNLQFDGLNPGTRVAPSFFRLMRPGGAREGVLDELPKGVSFCPATGEIGGMLLVPPKSTWKQVNPRDRTGIAHLMDLSTPNIVDRYHLVWNRAVVLPIEIETCRAEKPTLRYVNPDEEFERELYGVFSNNAPAIPAGGPTAPAGDQDAVPATGSTGNLITLHQERGTGEDSGGGTSGASGAATEKNSKKGEEAKGSSSGTSGQTSTSSSDENDPRGPLPPPQPENGLTAANTPSSSKQSRSGSNTPSSARRSLAIPSKELVGKEIPNYYAVLGRNFSSSRPKCKGNPFRFQINKKLPLGLHFCQLSGIISGCLLSKSVDPEFYSLQCMNHFGVHMTQVCLSGVAPKPLLLGWETRMAKSLATRKDDVMLRDYSGAFHPGISARERSKWCSTDLRVVQGQRFDSGPMLIDEANGALYPEKFFLGLGEQSLPSGLSWDSVNGRIAGWALMEGADAREIRGVVSADGANFEISITILPNPDHPYNTSIVPIHESGGVGNKRAPPSMPPTFTYPDAEKTIFGRQRFVFQVDTVPGFFEQCHLLQLPVNLCIIFVSTHLQRICISILSC